MISSLKEKEYLKHIIFSQIEDEWKNYCELYGEYDPENPHTDHMYHKLYTLLQLFVS